MRKAFLFISLSAVLSVLSSCSDDVCNGNDVISSCNGVKPSPENVTDYNLRVPETEVEN